MHCDGLAQTRSGIRITSRYTQHNPFLRLFELISNGQFNLALIYTTDDALTPETISHMVWTVDTQYSASPESLVSRELWEPINNT